MFIINPQSYLYPLLEEWPASSNSAYTLLGRIENDEILLLSNSKYFNNAPLNTRIPIESQARILSENPNTNVITYQTFLLDTPITVSALAVPDSPWILFSRIDSRELYAPARQRLWTVLFAILLLLACIMLLIWAMWQRQERFFIRKQLEADKALIQSENNLQSIFSSMRDGILVADAATKKFVMANAAISNMLGYSRDELMSMSVLDIHPPESLPYALDQFQKGLIGEIELASRIPVLRRDGSIFPSDINATPIMYAGRECAVGVFRDITAQTKAEQKIFHLNAVLRGVRDVNQLITRATDAQALIANACESLVEARGFNTVVICITDAEGQRVVSTASAGYEPGTFEEKFSVCIPDFVVKAMKSKTPVVQSYQGKNGSDYTIALGLYNNDSLYGFMIVMMKDVFIDESEELDLLTEAAHDIAFALHTISLKSDYKKSIETLAETEEQLRQSQKLEAIGQLAGGIAHDFNNLLMVQMGYCELLKDRIEDDSLLYDIDLIHQCALKSAALTSQLLAFSRKQALHPRIVSLNDLVFSMEKIIKRLIGEHIETKTILSDNLWHVRVDPGQIEQVLLNLAVNARDAMNSGGLLSISTANLNISDSDRAKYQVEKAGEYVMISVADTGSGMDESVKSRAFEPFFTTKEPGKGTGLGLSTVYGIVKQSGGVIWFESKANKGTTFNICFPRAQSELSQNEEKRLKAISGSGELILVVEDEPVLRKLLERMGKELGYKFVSAANGHKAIEMIENSNFKPKIVLTDMVMPGMSGKELILSIREKLPDIKFICMSGYTANFDELLDELSDKHISFLQKPFTRQDLSEKILQCLSS